MASTHVPESATADGIVSILTVTSRNVFVVGAVIAASIYLLDFILSPRLDPDEPVLVKPSVPLIGHIIGIIRHQGDYNRIVQKKHPLPIASLQMLWGKMYAVWDPVLVQAVLRSREPSLEPFFLEFAKTVFGLSRELFVKIKGEARNGLVNAFVDSIHGSMNATAVQKMNVTAVGFIAEALNEATGGESGTMEQPNMYLWLRDLITIPTTRVLFGKENPFEKDGSLVQTLWDWEENMAQLILRPFPYLTARKPYRARAKVQAALTEWYTAGHDTDDPAVAQLTRDRAATLRRHGFDSAEVAQIESILPIVGVTNTAPTMFWIISYVYARPQLVGRLRNEVDGFVRREGGVATVDIAKFEEGCPLLTRCYRETLRLRNTNVSTRRLMGDLAVVDGAGRSYVLKKGVDVQLPAGVTHGLDSVWDGNAGEFDPDHFLEKGQKAGSEKAKRNAYVPFGGGRHLCPGRSFAYTEIMTVACTLLGGFEVEALGVGFGDIRPGVPPLVGSLVKPADDGRGLGVRLSRRKGWEGVEWRYKAD